MLNPTHAESVAKLSKLNERIFLEAYAQRYPLL